MPALPEMVASYQTKRKADMNGSGPKAKKVKKEEASSSEDEESSEDEAMETEKASNGK